MISVFLICLALGALVGFLAGLLGIGGGLVIVPVLSALLYNMGIVDQQSAFLVAVATSLCSIIFTSFSSALTHHKQNNVNWSLAVRILGGVGLGAGMASFFAHKISADGLRTIFAVTVTFVAFRMAFSKTSAEEQDDIQPNMWLAMPVSAVIGALSSLIGIGGGALIVPMLSQLHYNVKKAIGVASAAGTCIAVVATVGYVTAGWNKHSIDEWYLGYIYLPALAGVIITSAIFAPIGARMVHRLPVKVLKRLFAAFLFAVVANMVFA